MKRILIVAGLLSPLCGQTVTAVSVNVNIQALSAHTIQAKYKVKMPRGIWAGSVVAENFSDGTMYLGQGSVIKALRDKGYPALSRTDAAAVILDAQNHGFPGFVLTNLPFAQKLLNSTQGLIVARAITVSSGVGIGIVAGAAIVNALTPDILARIQAFEQSYDTDGLQNLLQLGPGQSAVGTIIFDSPPKRGKVTGESFSIDVPVVQVTGRPQIAVQ